MRLTPDAYEKLGAFYLGREYDLDSGAMKDEPLLYDSKDLTNLLLTFPDLRPKDFAPWINPDDAQRKGAETK